MKICSFLTLLLVTLSLFWVFEICIQQLEQRCHVEISTTDRIILAVKELFGMPSPEPKLWRSLCFLTGTEIKGKLNILFGCIILTACILFTVSRYRAERERVEIMREMAEDPEERVEIIREMVEDPGQEYYGNPKKRPRDENTDIRESKRIKFSSRQFRPRPKKARRPRHVKSLFDGYHLIPHIPTTEQSVYLAVLLRPVNDCFKYITALLTATFGLCGAAPGAIKWSYNFDPVGTMTYLTGESDRLKVEVQLVPDDGMDICIYRVVKVEGLLRFVQSRSYQLTYMGLTCVDQCSNTIYGAGWDL